MPYLQISGPAEEPIEIDDVKLSARIDQDADDELIGQIITDARQFCENYCNLSFITQTWKYVFDSFPGLATAGSLLINREYSLPANALLLEKGPVQSIASIGYLDMSSTPQVMPQANYTLSQSNTVNRVTPVFGQIWPVSLPQIGACSVQFVAGFGPDGTTLPGPIRRALLLLCSHFYNNRDAIAAGQMKEMPFGVSALLDPYQLQVI